MSDAPRAILAEDEAPQREALVAMLAQAWPELRVVACEDGIAALEAVALHRPQVAFLDSRMPGVGGLDVARTVAGCGGHVVFTTAYDEYAVSAFEAGALDYLLKPIAEARLAQAVARVRTRLGEATPAAAIDALEGALRPRGEREVRWITAGIGDSVRLIGIDEVVYFQAQDKYVRVVTARDEALIRTPLREVAAGLDPDVFWQVHRGLVVRVAAIDRLRRDELGRHALQLKGRDERLPVSAAFVQRFRGM
jgi:DNA-binding LytR/AlgR family response regulator